MTYQDYILRHIQQASRAWARIVRMIKDRQFETAHMVLDQAYRQLIGLSPEAVLERTPNDLIAVQEVNAQVAKTASGERPTAPPVRRTTIRRPDMR